MQSNPQSASQRPPPLRPYQLEAARAILTDVAAAGGRTFVVEISRQGGKNELSARIEALLLARYALAGGSAIKTAPTLEPQLRTSYNRLADTLRRDHIAHAASFPAVRVGRAYIEFRSAEKSANVVGATASLLLEVDEAQDVDEEIFDTRFRPMAATTGATTVLYGTAWSEVDLLQRTIAANRAAQERDGVRRNFLFDWREVARYLPAYSKFVRAERERLGADDPRFTTQYELQPLEGEGRLFNERQLAQLQGEHARERGALLGAHYVAGLDIAGQDTGSGRANDRTVLTIGRLVEPDTAQRAVGLAPVAIVDQIATRGLRHDELIPMLTDTLRARRVGACVIDATGIGESTAAILAAALPQCDVEAFKFTQTSKSDLGFNLISYVNTGAIKLYADDGSGEHALSSQEFRNARRELRPNNTMSFSVPEALGNDDFLISAALLARCARLHPARRAHMR